MLFNVTYELVTPESAEHGEAEERGFVAEDIDLRSAIEEIGYCAMEADSYPISHKNPPRWFTNYEYGNGTRDYFEKGIEESRSLHLPDNITPSSALRVARLLGIKVN